MKNYLLFLLFPIALIGCGQAGPLYLPDAPPPIHVEKPKTEAKTPTETTPEAKKTK